jgi:hypothetical protein
MEVIDILQLIVSAAQLITSVVLVVAVIKLVRRDKE